MTRTRRGIFAALTLAAVSTAAPGHADEVGQIVTFEGKQYRVEGISTSAGQDGPEDGVNGYGAAGWVTDSLGLLPPVRPCVPSSVSISIGDLTGVGLADLVHPGDVYYKWSAPTTVKFGGHCDKETISRQTYTDTPVITTSGALIATGGPFEARGKDVPHVDKSKDIDITVLQAPEWSLLYYSARNLYVRSLFGSLEVRVRASYIDARTNLEVTGPWCKTKTWYFTTNPQQPSYTTQTDVTAC